MGKINNIERDLARVTTLITADWRKQNNELDNKTKFVYKVNSLDECLAEIDRLQVDKFYALHRWYNFHTSVRCEYIFCEYGAVHEADKYNHDVDIFIDGIPFDVKLTTYPKALASRPFDLTKREGKDAMIRWYYKNQSQEARKQMLNRLYVVCDGNDEQDNLEMKCNFDLMREKIKAFMEEAMKNGVNTIKIEDKGESYILQSDIIVIN